MVKSILFDLDGTLLDTLGDLANATNAVLLKHGISAHSMDAYRQFVGNGARNLLKQASGQSDDAVLDRMLCEFLEQYNANLINATKPYDGVIETLDFLLAKGISLAVVTNKPHIQAVALVKHFFSNRFTCVYGGCDEYPKKPHPQGGTLAMTSLGTLRHECVFVGDSDVDVYTAHNLGIPCIGCAFGFRGEEELIEASADEIVYSFAELQKNRLIFE